MSDLFDVIADLEQEAAHECLVHAVTPDMATACGLGVLDVSVGCKRGGHLFFGGNWSRVTCVWCHSLGRAWFHERCRRLQDRQAVAA